MPMSSSADVTEAVAAKQSLAPTTITLVSNARVIRRTSRLKDKLAFYVFENFLQFLYLELQKDKVFWPRAGWDCAPLRCGLRAAAISLDVSGGPSALLSPICNTQTGGNLTLQANNAQINVGGPQGGNKVSGNASFTGNEGPIEVYETGLREASRPPATEVRFCSSRTR